jgi:hypothetical protein
MRKIILCLLIYLPISIAAQNVGIGTTSPTGKLQINHRTATGVGLRLIDSTNNSAGSIEFRNVSRPAGIHLRGYTESNFYNGQYLDVTSDSVFVATFRANGKVGIRNGNPQHPLDVDGDINTTGTLRVNGDAGGSGQVLRSNGDGTMDWRSMQFENMATFRSPGTGSWVVPAGVTKIMVEVWGAGGGGSAYGGGGGGAYMYGYFTVTPGQTISYNIGDGGAGDLDEGVNGQLSSVTVGGTASLIASGGNGSLLFGSVLQPTHGGSFNASGTSNYFGRQGQPGAGSVYTYMQSGSTTFLQNIAGGKGGNAANSENTGGPGATLLYNLSTSTIMRSKEGNFGRQPGGGGNGGYYLSAAVFLNGGGGGDGMVSFHY